MPKVLITGVAGFLGSHVADTFLLEGWEVVGVDSLIGGYRSNVPDGVGFEQLDLAEDALPQKFLKDLDLVVHAACTAYEGLSVFSPSLVVKNTVQATTNLLSQVIGGGGAKRFVYLSSMARYGTQSSNFYTEDMTPAPQDPYGIAKLASESLVRNLAETFGMEWVILVPHNIIGVRQKYDDPYRNVASIFINRILQGKAPIIYGDGSQKRCFSFVSDVTEPLFRACTNESSVGQIINVGPDEEPVTILELAALVAEVMGSEISPEFVTGRPNEVHIALCSSEKARSLLGYETKVPLRDGILELSKWIQSEGKKEFDYHLPLEIVNEQTPSTWRNREM